RTSATAEQPPQISRKPRDASSELRREFTQIFLVPGHRARLKLGDQSVQPFDLGFQQHLPV
ncbi:TPA: hypothetical protein ACYLM8_008202, partial [Burkholderia lata]